KTVCGTDPLAQDVTSFNWPTLLQGDSDGIVPLHSETDDLTLDHHFILDAAHSKGVVLIGFLPPTEHQVAAGRVLELLNTPRGNLQSLQAPFVGLPRPR